MKGQTGQVRYLGRAFHQDAMEAMKGDVIRALIETITNSDDAYGDNRGKIRIEVEHRRRRGPSRVTTRDRAKGMRTNRLQEAIVELGGRTSGFESGAKVRGNLGRGAKDLAAFGTVTFESICDDRYSKLVLQPNGRYQLDPECKATNQHREDLKIQRGNGTVVTIEVADNIRCPQHDKLRKRLSTHYQLRDILSNPQREVCLVDVTSGREDRLRYEYPPLPTVFDSEVAVAGYPNANAHVTIFRNVDRYEGPPSQTGRPHGLLIKGRRAIYENTLFSCENNPFAGWFSGYVKCEYIDFLASDYDDRLNAGEPRTEENLMPIITRRRDGLQHDHPFFRALASVVGKELERLVADEEAKSRKDSVGENRRMRRALDALGQDLGRLIDEDLRDIEEEGVGGGLGRQPGNPPPIRLVPEQAVAYVGEDKTLSVIVQSDLGVTSVEVDVDPAGVVELIDDGPVPLEPHRRRSDVLVGQIHLRPLLEDEETMLSVRIPGHEAIGLVEVRAERVVEEVEVEVPDTLQFERDSYRVSYLKRRTLLIQAPIALVDAAGDMVRVSSSDPGVVVLGEQIRLGFDEELLFFVGQVSIDPRRLGAKSTITARLGETSTTCNVVVAKEDTQPKLLIRIEDEEAGSRRAIVEHEGESTVIHVMGRHPAFKRYRGPAPDFPGDDAPTTKVVLAEILATEATRIVMEKKFPFQCSDALDAPGFYAEHFVYLNKYLQRCHRALVDDALVGA